ncbi:hypothetical protein [Streptomyces sp. t39]|uniref:hypothetical protein n=1 Tax=Streptomyces sp. t39 TaxID=1828156 RepID=UPI0011CDA801|nr:hypothetical protein [Streptomyces sp. t39]TXS35136.1 hypothetical protein EAO77_37745 [Streptomyces sp. t39]
MNLHRLRNRLHRAPAAQDDTPPPGPALGPDERRMQHYLRVLVDGEPVPVPHADTTERAAGAQDRSPYWLDQLLAARRHTPPPGPRPDPESAPVPDPDPVPDSAPDPDSGPDTARPATETGPGERSAWWRIGPRPALLAPAPPAPEPGIHITVVQHADPAGPTARERARWWAIRRGTAGAVGYWLFGLGPLVARRLEEAGPGAIGFAVLLWAVCWFAAAKATSLIPDKIARRITPEIRMAADWALHIPASTVLLALALHTPGATL